jgi:hypothetical protein
MRANGYQVVGGPSVWIILSSSQTFVAKLEQWTSYVRMDDVELKMGEEILVTTGLKKDSLSKEIAYLGVNAFFSESAAWESILGNLIAAEEQMLHRLVMLNRFRAEAQDSLIKASQPVKGSLLI